MMIDPGGKGAGPRPARGLDAFDFTQGPELAEWACRTGLSKRPPLPQVEPSRHKAAPTKSTEPLRYLRIFARHDPGFSPGVEGIEGRAFHHRWTLMDTDLI